MLLWLVFVALCLAGCGSGEREVEPLRVFAASSLVPALERLAQEGNPAFTVTGGSSALMARQILAGATADVFITAHQDWTQDMVKRNAWAHDGRFILMHNALVFVAREGLDVGDVDWRAVVRDSPDRVAVADFETVPLGMYTVQALHAEGIDLPMAAGFVVGQHAQATLRLVATGEADFGFVYATDALASGGVEVVAQIEPKLHERINYMVVPLSKRGHEMRDFWISPRAVAVFRAAGFNVPDRVPERLQRRSQ